jgi:propanol-preferring alcohol dehydrogenase
MICVRWYLITTSAITIAGVVTVPVAASARNNLKIRISLRRVSILREDQLPHPHIPIIPGHDIVGRVDALGDGVSGLTIGERVGIPWLAAVGFVE